MTFVGYGGISVRRQGVQGLHVHVGMPSAEECWRCLEAILPWLPVVLALSANSPWFAGELTGMASNRAPVLAELPRAGGAAGVRVVRASGRRGSSGSSRLGVTRGLHAHLVGRAPASEARHARGAHPRPADRRAALGRVRRARCRRCARRRSTAGCRSRRVLGDRGRADYAQNRWAAARFGPARELIHPDGDVVRARAELGAELLELVRPAARALGGDGRARAPRPDACEADLQLERRSPREAAADLVAPLASLSAWRPSPRRSRSAASAARRCVMRLAKTLEGAEGLESANANLMGQVHALLRRRAHHAGCARRGDGPRRLPRAAVRLNRIAGNPAPPVSR